MGALSEASRKRRSKHLVPISKTRSGNFAIAWQGSSSRQQSKCKRELGVKSLAPSSGVCVFGWTASPSHRSQRYKS